MKTIEVTGRDIDQGEPRSCERCAVALAVRRAYGVDDVDVTPHGPTIWITVLGRCVRAPAVVREFVDAFDELPLGGPFADDRVVPFRFDLPDLVDAEWLGGMS